jgi:hypothetical protein
MKVLVACCLLSLAAVVGTGVFAGEALKSGPQVGQSPGAFDPLHVTGESAGEKSCLV